MKNRWKLVNFTTDNFLYKLDTSSEMEWAIWEFGKSKGATYNGFLVAIREVKNVFISCLLSTTMLLGKSHAKPCNGWVKFSNERTLKLSGSMIRYEMNFFPFFSLIISGSGSDVYLFHRSTGEIDKIFTEHKHEVLTVAINKNNPLQVIYYHFWIFFLNDCFLSLFHVTQSTLLLVNSY